MIASQPQQTQVPAAEAQLVTEAEEARANKEVHQGVEAEDALTETVENDRKQQLAALQFQVDEHLEKWRRIAAEFANYKKRQERDRSQFMKYANAGLITRLLPILDDFHRALETVPPDIADRPWMDGMALIERKLLTTLEQEGITQIQADRDQPFDPACHEALTWEETTEVADGHIIEQVQQGYVLHDRVLRPSLVRVARGISVPAGDDTVPQRTQEDSR